MYVSRHRIRILSSEPQTVLQILLVLPFISDSPLQPTFSLTAIVKVVWWGSKATDRHDGTKAKEKQN